MKPIYILLTRYPDKVSTFFRRLIGGHYSHVSIATELESGIYYSFVTKGFRVEKPLKYSKYKGQEIECKLYKIDVSDEQLRAIKNYISCFIDNKEDYKFSYMGVLLCLLGIKKNNYYNYFCSQFVCEVLKNANALPIKKDPSLYLPDEFMQMQHLKPCYHGTLSGMDMLINGPKPTEKMPIPNALDLV